MKPVSIFLFILGANEVVNYVSGDQRLRHPQEIDMSSLADESLLKWTEKSTDKVDCSSYYRRLVKHLFSKKRFNLDSASEYHIANIPLRIKHDQYELLVNNELDGLNMNEVDDLLDEIFKQSSDELWNGHLGQIFYDHYRQQLVDLLPSFSSPVVLISTALLVVFLSYRFLHLSKLTFSAIIVLLGLALVGISYTMSYYDCLNDLEVEQMIKLSKQQSANNPCEDYHGERESFLGSFRTAILGSSENKCLEHIRNTLSSSKKFCDPLDVAAKWFSKIQMSYISSILDGLIKAISEATSSSSIITRLLTWIFSGIVILFFLLSFGKAVIKYSFKGAVDMLKSTRLQQEDSNHRPDPTANEMMSLKLDRILEENQQMKRELSFIRESSVERSLQMPQHRKENLPALEEESHEETYQ